MQININLSSGRKDRIVQFDILKSIAIILVVYGHVLQYFSPGDYMQNGMFLWISTFHMPLFMTISGFFAYSMTNISFKEIMLKRCRQLLLPCLSWTIIVCIVCFLLYNCNKVQSPQYKYTFLNAIWFLKSAFVCCVLGFIGIHHNTHRPLWLFFSLIISQFILIWNVFIMYPCFVVGLLLFKYHSWLVRNLKEIALFSGFIFWTGSIYLSIDKSFWLHNLGIREALFNGNIDVVFLCHVVFRRYFQLMIGISGSLWFIATAYLFCDKFPKRATHFVSEIGGGTLGIYVIQTVLLETILAKTMYLPVIRFYIFNIIIAPIIAFCVIYISVIIIRFIRKKQWISAILLGTNFPSK